MPRLSKIQFNLIKPIVLDGNDYTSIVHVVADIGNYRTLKFSDISYTHYN